MKTLATVASILIIGLCSTIAHDNLPNPDTILKQLSNVNISGLNNFNTSAALPPTEDVQKKFREKCEKNGGPAAFDGALKAQPYLTECFESLVNYTKLQEEMKAARPEGKLDEVFKEYCRKVPIVKKCVNNATVMIEPCLELKEQESLKIINNITASLLKFICHKDGDRIALFMAAGGQECLANKSEAMQQCAKSTLKGYAPAASPAAGAVADLESFPLLVLGNKECNDMVSLQECTVKELEACSDPTPANVVDSLFNFIIKVTPCENLLQAQKEAASRMTGGGAASIGNVLLLTIIMGISVRFA